MGDAVTAIEQFAYYIAEFIKMIKEFFAQLTGGNTEDAE